MTYISIVIANFLLYLGVDMPCICSHRHSDHDFDSLTPSGFCQDGDYATGCGCMRYEVKGNRQFIDRRG